MDKKHFEIKQKYASNMNVHSGNNTNVLMSVIADRKSQESEVRLPQHNSNQSLAEYVIKRRKIVPLQLSNSPTRSTKLSVHTLDVDEN